jgi:hypothetical protein
MEETDTERECRLKREAREERRKTKLEEKDPVFLQQNYEVDKAYFDLKKITPKKSIGESLVVVDPKETEDRARALSHETGLIIVSDYNTGTNTTVGIGKRYMAALYPTETGNMVMNVNEICNQQPVMTLPSVNMTNEYIPVTFLLSRFSGHNKLVNLVWKEGFTMQGTLRGVHPLKMK